MDEKEGLNCDLGFGELCFLARFCKADEKDVSSMLHQNPKCSNYEFGYLIKSVLFLRNLEQEGN